MAGFAALAIGAGIGYLAARARRKKQQQAATPAPSTAGQTPEQQVAATNPPDAARDASMAQATAVGEAARVRKRAAAGNAGRRTSPITGAQQGVMAGTAYRTLLGG